MRTILHPTRTNRAGIANASACVNPRAIKRAAGIRLIVRFCWVQEWPAWIPRRTGVQAHFHPSRPAVLGLCIPGRRHGAFSDCIHPPRPAPRRSIDIASSPPRRHRHRLVGLQRQATSAADVAKEPAILFFQDLFRSVKNPLQRLLAALLHGRPPFQDGCEISHQDVQALGQGERAPFDARRRGQAPFDVSMEKLFGFFF